MTYQHKAARGPILSVHTKTDWTPLLYCIVLYCIFRVCFSLLSLAVVNKTDVLLQCWWAATGEWRARSCRIFAGCGWEPAHGRWLSADDGKRHVSLWCHCRHRHSSRYVSIMFGLRLASSRFWFCSPFTQHLPLAYTVVNLLRVKKL